MPGELLVTLGVIVLLTLHHQTSAEGKMEGDDLSVSHDENRPLNKTVITILFRKKIITTMHEAPKPKDEGDYSDEPSEESGEDSESGEGEIAVRSFKKPKLNKCEQDVCW